MSGRWAGVTACAIGAVAAGTHSCWRQQVWPGPSGPAPVVASAPPPASEPAVGQVSVERPHGAHPRILLTADRLAALRGLHAAGAPKWRALAQHCDDAARQPIDSGYESWDWANAALDLALCHAVTHKPDYAKAALSYFRAVFDDRYKVGDGAGGDEVVRHDEGYSMRTHGCFGAIALDWLHDAPGMTPELRKHAVDRLVAWQRWYAEKGYNNDQPIANYYMGYFGAVAFGGIAAEGDDPRAVDMLRRAQRMFNAEIVPVYKHSLAGGDFPEGWQYGDMVGAILAIFADAESRPGAGRSPFDELPWLRQVVAYRAHALWPDGKHTFDTGDWSEKPAVAPAHMLLALATVLPPGHVAARQARALARAADDPSEEWHWLTALADDPSRLAEDPRRGPTSYFARGTATVTARTDWTPAAVWMAVTSAPSLSDHQHLDAGHFEIVRGGDALIVDAGGYGSFSSLSHNIISVDDRKENDTYSPNQGTWSDTAGMARYQDDPRFVYALADYASAYNPSGYPKNHAQRTVARAERALVFSRSPLSGMAESARLVVYDRVTLTKPTYAATFLLHGGSAPEVQGESVRFVVGKSAAFATTLLPAGATRELVREPTKLGDGPYYANEPPEGKTSTRVEVRSRADGLERRFLHAIVVGPSDAHPPVPVRIDGPGVDGVAVDDEAYVFQRGGPQERAAAIEYRAPLSATRHLVASLAPNARYAVSVERERDSCRVSLQPGEGPRASDAGVLTVEIAPGCSTR
jgi:hypothetical protein